jgi:hypothetical protein
MKCTATNGKFVCELEQGHSIRHNAAGAEPWMDQAVVDARALARQNREKTEDGKKLLDDLILKVAEIIRSGAQMYSESRLDAERFKGEATRILWLVKDYQTETAKKQ